MSLPAAAVLREQETDALEAELAAVAATLNAAHGELVDLTRRLLEDDRWAGGGIRSPEHWLVARAGLSPARAADVVRLARRAGELPTTVTALSEGRMSVDQASVVARYAPAGYEQSVGELALFATVPQLRRALTRYQFATDGPAAPAESADERDSSAAEAGAAGTGESEAGAAEAGAAQVGEPDAGAAEAGGPPVPPWVPGDPLVPGTEAYACAPPELTMAYGDGRFRLRFDAPADLGALVEQAVKEAKDALFQAGNPKVTYADGLAEVARRSLSAASRRGSRLAHYRVYVHLSTEGGWVGGKGGIPASLAAKYACDGVVQPVWETEGTPVNVGRAQRLVPKRTRRLVQDRDRGCVFPGCTATGFLEVHHLDHWAKGGATDLDRLAVLCPYHHDAHHRGEFTVVGRPVGDPVRAHGGLTFRDARGRVICPEPGLATVHPLGVPLPSTADVAAAVPRSDPELSVLRSDAGTATPATQAADQPVEAETAGSAATTETAGPAATTETAGPAATTETAGPANNPADRGSGVETTMHGVADALTAAHPHDMGIPEQAADRTGIHVAGDPAVTEGTGDSRQPERGLESRPAERGGDLRPAERGGDLRPAERGGDPTTQRTEERPLRGPASRDGAYGKRGRAEPLEPYRGPSGEHLYLRFVDFLPNRPPRPRAVPEMDQPTIVGDPAAEAVMDRRATAGDPAAEP